jgi:SAM-dependent methyltransferase
MEQYIKSYKDEFPEWYAPLELGMHKIPARTFPTFHERWDSFHDNTLGKKKWDYIIKNALPDLTFKYICDIGCNIGIFAMEMARLGASVDGYDRGKGIIQANNPNLGDQSVADQAYFVRNLYEAFYAERLNVKFFETDLMQLDFSLLKYDLFFSACTLYHLGAAKMEEAIAGISQNIKEVFLQTNECHGGELGRLAKLAHHRMLLEKYGYTIIREVAPLGYAHPVIYASK